jgi:hypothetical protein
MFPLAPLRRSTIIAVPGAGVKCGSTRRSSISSLALPNLREERWLCLSLGVLAVTESLWNTPGSKVRPKGAKFTNLERGQEMAASRVMGAGEPQWPSEEAANPR